MGLWVSWAGKYSTYFSSITLMLIYQHKCLSNSAQLLSLPHPKFSHSCCLSAICNVATPVPHNKPTYIQSSASIINLPSLLSLQHSIAAKHSSPITFSQNLPCPLSVTYHASLNPHIFLLHTWSQIHTSCHKYFPVYVPLYYGLIIYIYL